MNDSGHGGRVALLGPNTRSLLVPHDAFFAVQGLVVYLGDSLSRKVVYHAPTLRHPFWYLLSSAAGAALCLAKVPLLQPLGMFLIFFANGSIYATSTKHIDVAIHHKYNLTALSVWLFIGDLGAVVGSNTWQRVAPLVCAGVNAPHMCL